MKKTLSILLSALLVITSLSPMTFAESSTTIEPYGDFNIIEASDDLVSIPTLAEGEIWAGKDVDYKGDGEFEISLLAGGKNFTKTTQLPQEQYDIVLVLDRSGSMGDDSKLASMKTAASGAVDALLAVPGNRVAVVSYSEDSKTEIGFTELAGISNIKTKINALKANDGTNIQNALLRTQNLLNARSTAEKLRKSIVILMSDGEPTFYHTSLSNHTNSNIEGNGQDTNDEEIWNTVLQAQQLKNSVSGLDIYTIGFGINTDKAKATLMPTATNTIDIRPMDIYSKPVTGSGEYLQYKSWGSWYLKNPVQSRNETYVYGASAYHSVGTSVPDTNWNTPTVGSPYSADWWDWSDFAYLRYATGSRTGTAYEGTPIAFAHQYWSTGSSFASSDLDALIEAFTDIVNSITNVAPHQTSDVATDLSDVVITDVVGDDFVIDNLTDLNTNPNVTVVGNTVTWTIPGEDFYTILASETALVPSSLNKLTIIVKVKEVAGIDLPTNDSASAVFNVDSENNPKYDSDNQTINIIKAGLITLEAVQGTIIENHVFTDDSSKNTTATHTDAVGATKTFEPVDHTGYTYTVDQANTEMTFTHDAQTITFTYTPIPKYTLTVIHEYPNGDEFADPVVTTDHVSGGSYSTSPATYDPADYTVTDSGNTSGTFGSENIVVTYTYTPIEKYSLTVIHEYPNGDEFADPVVTTNHVSGATYSTSPATYDPADYTVTDSGNTSGIFGSVDIVVTYTYTPIDKYSLTVNHVLSTGGNFADAVVTSGHVAGELYSTSPVYFDPANYTVSTPANASGIFVEGHVEVTYTYTPIAKYTLTVKHELSTGGNFSAPEVTTNYTSGQEYSSAPVAFDSEAFTVNTPANASGTFGQSDIEVTYVYTPIIPEEPDTYTLTVYHLLSTGGNFSAPEVTTDNVSGDEYFTTPVDFNPDDFTVNTPENATGTFGESDIEVTYIYTPITPEEPDTYTLTVNHLLYTGGNYAPQEVTPNFQPEDAYFTTHAPYDVTLYSVSIPGNASGTFGNSDINVNYIYTSLIPDPTEGPTEEPTEGPVDPPTEEPTEGPVDPTTEPEPVVEVEEEEIPLAAPTMSDIDRFLTPLPEEEEIVEVEEEETPLADALPDTGQLPTELFFGVGGLISAAGAFLKKKK